MDAYDKYLASNPTQCVVCARVFASDLPGITKEFTGEYYSFCSAKCIEAFEQNPEQYASFEEEEDE